jgi:hypothetical protein
MSANAGKVMLGADGYVLRGHDGKIVLADNLYPMHAAYTASASYRKAQTYLGGTIAQNPIWGATWESSGADGAGSQVVTRMSRESVGGPIDASSWNSWQRATKYTMTGIEWNRVNKCRLSYRLTIRGIDSSGYAFKEMPYKCFFGVSGAEPDGDNEPWNGAGWTMFASGVTEEGTVEVGGVADIMDCDGIVWLAAIIDVTAPVITLADTQFWDGMGTISRFCGASISVSIIDPQAPDYDVLPFKIIYNLAT